MADVDDELRARLQAHAAHLDRVAEPAGGRRPAPRRPALRTGLLAAAALAVVALVVGAVVERSTDDVATIAPAAPDGGGGDETQSTEGPVAVEPFVPPADWQRVEFQGLEAHVPPDWEVRTEGCPGGDRSVLLATTAAIDCVSPGPDDAWLWLSPARDRGDVALGCVEGGIEALTVCSLPAAPGEPTAHLVAGIDVAITFSEGAARDPEVHAIASTWRYVQPAPQEPLSQAGPLGAAEQFGLAFASGDCAMAQDVLAPDATVGCTSPRPDPTESLAGAAATVGTDRRGGATVELFPSQRVLALDLSFRWSLEEARGSWFVVDAREAGVEVPVAAPCAGGCEELEVDGRRYEVTCTAARYRTSTGRIEAFLDGGDDQLPQALVGLEGIDPADALTGPRPPRCVDAQNPVVVPVLLVAVDLPASEVDALLCRVALERPDGC